MPDTIESREKILVSLDPIHADIDPTDYLDEKAA
jgi:hypothetical protein